MTTTTAGKLALAWGVAAWLAFAVCCAIASIRAESGRLLDSRSLQLLRQDDEQRLASWLGADADMYATLLARVPQGASVAVLLSDGDRQERLLARWRVACMGNLLYPRILWPVLEPPHLDWRPARGATQEYHVLVLAPAPAHPALDAMQLVERGDDYTLLVVRERAP